MIKSWWRKAYWDVVIEWLIQLEPIRDEAVWYCVSRRGADSKVALRTKQEEEIIGEGDHRLSSQGTINGELTAECTEADQSWKRSLLSNVLKYSSKTFWYICHFTTPRRSKTVTKTVLQNLNLTTEEVLVDQVEEMCALGEIGLPS